LPLAAHTVHRRSELQAIYMKFESDIEKLNGRVKEQAGQRSGARLLMTHPGVGRLRRWRPTCSWVIRSVSVTDGKTLAGVVRNGALITHHAV
jgi:hypothetical protein